MRETTTNRETAHRRLAAALRVESPFPWQLALLERFLNGDPPSSIDVPTGLGKTAVMAIWLVARAAGAPLPRRLVYVVDRRAVVDQATEVAEHLRELVEGDCAMKLDLMLSHPLPISTLRGKHLDNRQWLDDPSVPAIVLGTVDMIGSRLLFQGYGVSPRMRSYHAGLLGADSLIVLDEAHLVPPFERLIEAIASGHDERGRMLGPEGGDFDGIVPPLRFLPLSATGRDRDGALRLSDDDRAHPVVARRLGAIKRASLRDPVSPKELPDKLAEEAWALSEAGTKPMRAIVFCNSRDDATKVQEELEKRRRKAGIEAEMELFVGGRRLFEREEAARWLAARGFFAGSGGRPKCATFVIATSAGEVGVDLDADQMVCDLVAWERMVQRLGRVNRRGEGDACVVIVPAGSEDAQMAGRLAAVRELLDQLPRSEEGAIDVSPGALAALKARCASDEALATLLERASTPAELHPPLSRATIESWSMTSLEEHTGRPEVAPWIRGWMPEEEPQTTVAWRKHLPVTDGGRLFGKTDLEAFREAADPHLAERLETETWRVVDWLGRRLKTLGAPEPGDAALDATARPLRQTDIAAVILDGPAGPRTLTADNLLKRQEREVVARALENGLVLVDERLGGLHCGLLSNESDDKSVDLTLINSEERLVPFRVRRLTEDEEPPHAEWRREACFAVQRSREEETAWLVVESLAGESAESEEGRSIDPKRAQQLDNHETWAGEAARDIAARLALPDPYAGMLEVAGRLHDEGKRSKCWQRAFKAPVDGIYAKTTSRPNLKLLGRYRHELGSLPYAECHERLRALDAQLRDLCLHLIAAHHGYSRPLIRTDSADEPPSLLVQRAQETALRFAQLERRWGPWGLAWWESLLRAADQRASRRNDLEGGGHG